MATLTTLTEDVRAAKRLLRLTTEIKVREKAADAIKAKFKARANGKDLTVEGGGVKLTVDQSSQLRVDLDKLRLELGAKLSDFQTETPVTKVTVKKVVI